MRRGPNVVGPLGLLQSFADGAEGVPEGNHHPFGARTAASSSSRRSSAFTLALVAWAVIPFGDGVVLADINVGLLYLLAVSSLGVYGIIMAGWASNSKYPFLASLSVCGADGQL